MLERYQPNKRFNSIPGTILKENATHYCDVSSVTNSASPFFSPPKPASTSKNPCGDQNNNNDNDLPHANNIRKHTGPPKHNNINNDVDSPIENTSIFAVPDFESISQSSYYDLNNYNGEIPKAKNKRKSAKPKKYDDNNNDADPLIEENFGKQTKKQILTHCSTYSSQQFRPNGLIRTSTEFSCYGLAVFQLLANSTNLPNLFKQESNDYCPVSDSIKSVTNRINNTSSSAPFHPVTQLRSIIQYVNYNRIDLTWKLDPQFKIQEDACQFLRSILSSIKSSLNMYSLFGFVLTSKTTCRSCKQQMSDKRLTQSFICQIDIVLDYSLQRQINAILRKPEISENWKCESKCKATTGCFITRGFEHGLPNLIFHFLRYTHGEDLKINYDFHYKRNIDIPVIHDSATNVFITNFIGYCSPR